jgi:hypothetical protein
MIIALFLFSARRVIGQAASCIERSLGLKFSMENLQFQSQDDGPGDDIEEEDEEAASAVAGVPVNSATASADTSLLQKRRNKRMKRSRILHTVEMPNSSDFTREQV